MGEEQDTQKMKKISAKEYDYDNDPRWSDYWSNILMPPHMASRSDVITHFQRKFYQRHILLKLMYLAPTTGYHQNVWRKIGITVRPLIYKHAPFLNSPLTAIQKW